MVQFGSGSGVELVGIQTPDVNIPPGGSFEVVAILRNHSSAIFLDPDGCSNSSTPCTGSDGYCINVKAEVGGNETDTTSCLNLPFSGVPPNQEMWSMTLTAPNTQGSHSVTAFATATGSGNRSGSVSDTITVSEDSQDVQDPGGGGGDNNNENGGGNSGFLQFAKQNPLLAGVGTVAGIVAVKEGTQSLFGGE